MDSQFLFGTQESAELTVEPSVDWAGAEAFSGGGGGGGGAGDPYDYLDTLGATYYKMNEASGNVRAYGSDDGDTAVELRTSGTGSLTYSQTLSTYSGAPHAIQYDGSIKLINDAGQSRLAYPNLWNETDQTIGVIFDVNGAVLSPENPALWMSGGDVSSNSSNDNSLSYFQIRSDTYVARAWHESGSGVDDNVYFGTVPPDTTVSGENMWFLTRDVSTNEYKMYTDVGGTLTQFGGTQTYTNDPTTTGGSNRIVIGGRLGDNSARAVNGMQIGLCFGINSVLTTGQMQEIITRCRG